MLIAFIKIAFRRLWLDKVNSILHILGLSVGICSLILISLYAVYELSYDRCVKNHERVFRLNSIGGFTTNSEGENALGTPILPKIIMKEQPGLIESTGYLVSIWGAEVSSEFHRAYEYDMYFASKSVFEVFGFQFVEGSADYVTDKMDIVISKQVADKYFDNKPALNQKITLDRFDLPFTVKGVIETMPKNVHFQCDFFIQLNASDFVVEPADLLFSFAYTYLKLAEGVRPEQVSAHFQSVIENHMAPLLEEHMGYDLETFYSRGNAVDFKLEPITDIHLYSKAEGNPYGASSMRYLFVFVSLGLMILLLTSLNYINMSLARSHSRYKDIALRKTMGASKFDLILQYLAGSVLLTFISAILAVALFELMMPSFEALADKPFAEAFFKQPFWIGLVFGFSFILGIINGLYPSLYLSSLNPLKGLLQFRVSNSLNRYFRSFLLLVQFCISIVIIFFAVTVNRQLKYIDSVYMGLDKDKIAVVHRGYSIRNDYQKFKHQLLQNPQIDAVVNMISIPGPSPYHQPFEIYKGEDTVGSKKKVMSYMASDPDIQKLYDFKLIRGRLWDYTRLGDTSAVVLNESAANLLGIGSVDNLEEYMLSIRINCPECRFKVIGIVKDFVFERIDKEIKPLVIVSNKHFMNDFVLVQVKDEITPEITDYIENAWYTYSNGSVFFCRSLADCWNENYQEENNTQKLLMIFSFISIVIASLGLYGMIIYVLQIRTREIGVRMVHGADEYRIVLLLMRELFFVLMVAAPVGLMVSYYIVNKWLLNFAYHVAISPLEIITPTLYLLITTLVAVLLTARKIARKNFTNALRYE